MGDDEVFDLIVVGGGLAGLSSAFFWLTEVDADARILIVEQSSRLGGPSVAHHHRVDGQPLISPGGALDLTFPSSFAEPVAAALQTVGIDLDRFRAATSPHHYATLDAGGTAVGFPSSVWGDDHVVTVPPSGGPVDLRHAPVSARARSDIGELFTAPSDWLADRSGEEKLAALRRTSCEGLLRTYADLDDDTYRFLRHSTSAQSGMTFDQHPALDGALVGYLGMAGIDLPSDTAPWAGLSRTGRQFYPHADPPIFRYPDGNATVARALAAYLLPDLYDAVDVDSRMIAETNVAALDRPGEPIRIRLNSTARRVHHRSPAVVSVDVDVADGGSQTLHAGAVVVTAPAAAARSLVPELADVQQRISERSGRYPMVSASIALRNWRAWRSLGACRLWWPSHPTWQQAGLQFPVAMGPVHRPTDPAEPVTATALGSLTQPGTTAAVGAAGGRARLRSTSTSDLAADLRCLLIETLGRAGLDCDRDLAAVRVETWPDGYARYGTSRDVPGDGSTSTQEKGRLAEGVGRVVIAGVDVIDHPFLDGALESAHTAIHLLAQRTQP